MTYVKIKTFTVEVKSLHTFQNLQNVDYYTKIRGITQNACYCLFSTDLTKILHIKDVHI